MLDGQIAAIVAISSPLPLATWSAMTVLSGAVQNVWHLLLTRVGVAVGEAGCLPASNSILCDHVPLNKRACFFALKQFENALRVLEEVCGR